MKTRSWMLAVAVFVVAGLGAGAQPPPPSPQGGGPQMPSGHPPVGPRGDVMMNNFFPPELIMHNQQALELSDEQEKAIRSAMQQMMAKFTDLQWQMSDEAEKLAALVKQTHPDEKGVLAQLDKVLGVENDIKRGQVGLMVKIKNILTPEQQTKLRELQRRRRPVSRGTSPGMRQGPGGPGGPPPQQ